MSTQSEVLTRIDEASRRALRGQEEADVRAVLRAYREAVEEIEAQIRSVWSEMQAAAEADPSRSTFLQWKMGREQSLLGMIRRRMDSLTGNWHDTLKSGILQQYTEQASRDAYALDMTTPPSVSVNTRAATPTIAEAAANTPWKASAFSDRVWALTDDTFREMQNQLAQSALLGEGVKDAVARIKGLEVLDGNMAPQYAIERLVRTELLKAADRAREQLYEDNADLVEGEEVVVTLDDRTCEICGPLDGQDLDSPEVQTHLDESDAMDRPPFHPNCRCSTAPMLKPWGELLGLGESPADLEDFPDGERIMRDPTTGKSILAPMMSYAEWLQKTGLAKAA